MKNFIRSAKLNKALFFNNRKLGKSLEVQVLGLIAIVFTLFSAFNVYVSYHEQKVQALNQARRQASAIADSVFSSLNSLMVQDSMDKRKFYLKLLKLTTGDLDHLRVFRSDSVVTQFGPGLPGEQPIDELDFEVLRTGKMVTRLLEKEGGRKLRFVVPFLMSEDRGGVNCLECHNGKPGDVNGAISMVLSLDSMDTAAFNGFVKLVILNLAGLVIMLAMVMYVLYRLVLTPLSKLRKGIETIEVESNLGKTIDVDSENEVGLTASAFNKMIHKFHGIINHMASLADHLAAATTELSFATEQSTGQAEVQSRKVTEMSGSIEEVNKAISSIAGNAVEMAKRTELTRRNAMSGGKIISGSSADIEKLSHYSQKIGNILLVIDDIAKKTDLLAINAAIEAANAGEQGKGFAVVADEVRKLAERTTSATSEISLMIQDIQQFTNTASESMKGSSNVMNKIIVDTTKVNQMVDLIAVATEKQAGIINEMLGAATTVKEYSEGFVRSAGQSRTVAGELSDQSIKLQEVVDQFKTK